MSERQSARLASRDAQQTQLNFPQRKRAVFDRIVENAKKDGVTRGRMSDCKRQVPVFNDFTRSRNRYVTDEVETMGGSDDDDELEEFIARSGSSDDASTDSSQDAAPSPEVPSQGSRIGASQSSGDSLPTSSRKRKKPTARRISSSDDADSDDDGVVLPRKKSKRCKEAVESSSDGNQPATPQIGTPNELHRTSSRIRDKRIQQVAAGDKWATLRKERKSRRRISETLQQHADNKDVEKREDSSGSESEDAYQEEPAASAITSVKLVPETRNDSWKLFVPADKLRSAEFLSSVTDRHIETGRTVSAVVRLELLKHAGALEAKSAGNDGTIELSSRSVDVEGVSQSQSAEAEASELNSVGNYAASSEVKSVESMVGRLEGVLADGSRLPVRMPCGWPGPSDGRPTLVAVQAEAGGPRCVAYSTLPDGDARLFNRAVNAARRAETAFQRDRSQQLL